MAEHDEYVPVKRSSIELTRQRLATKDRHVEALQEELVKRTKALRTAERYLAWLTPGALLVAVVVMVIMMLWLMPLMMVPPA